MTRGARRPDPRDQLGVALYGLAMATWKSTVVEALATEAAMDSRQF
jgi:hypothetical protein